MEWKNSPTFLHMASTGNWTKSQLIFSLEFCAIYWHLVSVRTFSAIYDHTILYICESSKSDIMPQMKWAVSLVIADGHLSLPQEFMWVCMGKNTHFITLSLVCCPIHPATYSHVLQWHLRSTGKRVFLISEDLVQSTQHWCDIWYLFKSQGTESVHVCGMWPSG